MTEEFFRIIAEQDKLYAVCFMIATVVCCALELERYFKRKNGNLMEV